MALRAAMTVLMILIAFCTIASFIWESQNHLKLSTNQSPDLPNWSLNTSYGIPFWVVVNSAGGPQSMRRILLYMEPQSFNEESLKKVFLGLASDYPEPYDLFITAYSDKAMIQRAIEAGKSEVSVDYNKGPEGEKAYQEYARKYLPLRSGYYRANFTRMRGEEKLDYSPDPDKEEHITIVIKKREPAYTGDPSHDLILSIEEGDVTLAKRLIAEGADINAQDKDQMTALMRAMDREYYDLVSLLLSKDVEVNTQDKSGWTPLMYASSSCGKTEIVRELIRRGAKLNVQNEYGFSALMVAANEGQRDTVKLLLERGADLNLKGKDGETALSLAEAKDYQSIVRLIKAKMIK